MSRLQEVGLQRAAMSTIVNLTSVFEGLASMRISQTKNQVLQSQQFFDELWQMYSQIRVDSLFRFGRAQHETAVDKELYIVVTAEGGFSGDIDQKLITWMLTPVFWSVSSWCFLPTMEVGLENTATRFTLIMGR